MCLAVPMRVVSLLPDDFADVEFGGVVVRASLAMVDGVAEGDYVIVHAGYAINRLDVEEAEKSLALFEEISRHLDQAPDALRTRIS